MVNCPYCGEQAEFVTGKVIYPHRLDLHNKNFWYCYKDSAYVGCHQPNSRLGYKGDEPLGRLANAELRKAKMLAHAAFDYLWKNKQTAKERAKARTNAYIWLAEQLQLSTEQCHIGLFDVDTCQQVVILCGGTNAQF